MAPRCSAFRRAAWGLVVLWCGAVFAAPNPAARGEGRPDAVVVMSYNLRNFAGMTPADGGEAGAVAAARSKPARETEAVVEVIRSVSPQILGAQEIGGEGDLEYLRGRLREAGLDYPHWRHLRGADEERCQAVLSVFPIVSDQSRPDVVYELDGARQRMRRGILDVTVAPPGWPPLRLVGVHLKSRRPAPGGEAVMRRHEALLVRRHLDGIFAETPGARVLLFGDLNDTPDQPPVREISGARGGPAYMTPLPLADDRGESWTFHAPAAGRYERVDYIFASAGLAPLVCRARSRVVFHPRWAEAGDHRPVVAVMLPGGGNAGPPGSGR